MALIDIHERTHAYSSRLYEYNVPFALLLDCVKPPRSADDIFYVTINMQCIHWIYRSTKSMMITVKGTGP